MTLKCLFCRMLRWAKTKEGRNKHETKWCLHRNSCLIKMRGKNHNTVSQWSLSLLEWLIKTCLKYTVSHDLSGATVSQEGLNLEIRPLHLRNKIERKHDTHYLISVFQPEHSPVSKYAPEHNTSKVERINSLRPHLHEKAYTSASTPCS